MTSSQPTQPLTGPQPTPSLAEYLRREAEDDNTFWRLEPGDHQNLLDEAIEEEAIEEIERLRAQLASVAAVADRMAPHAENMCRNGYLEIGVPLRAAVRDIRAALGLDQDGRGQTDATE